MSFHGGTSECGEGATMVLGVAATKLKRFDVAEIAKLKNLSFCKEINFELEKNFQSWAQRRISNLVPWSLIMCLWIGH